MYFFLTLISIATLLSLCEEQIVVKTENNANEPKQVLQACQYLSINYKFIAWVIKCGGDDGRFQEGLAPTVLYLPCTPEERLWKSTPAKGTCINLTSLPICLGRPPSDSTSFGSCREVDSGAHSLGAFTTVCWRASSTLLLSRGKPCSRWWMMHRGLCWVPFPLSWTSITYDAGGGGFLSYWLDFVLLFFLTVYISTCLLLFIF